MCLVGFIVVSFCSFFSVCILFFIIMYLIFIWWNMFLICWCVISELLVISMWCGCMVWLFIVCCMCVDSLLGMLWMLVSICFIFIIVISVLFMWVIVLICVLKFSVGFGVISVLLL